MKNSSLKDKRYEEIPKEEIEQVEMGDYLEWLKKGKESSDKGKTGK